MKINSIQLLRFCAASLVLVAHLKFDLEVVYGQLVLPRVLQGAAGAVGVDIFFVISGFIICYTVSHGNLSAGAFFRHRFFRIVPVYYLYTLPLLILAILHRQLTANALVNSFLFLPLLDTERFTSPLHMYGWTLCFEVWFYAVFGLLLIWIRRPSVPGVVPAIFISAGAIGMLLPSSGWFFIRFVLNPMCVEFALGCVAFLIFDKARRSVAVGWIGALLAVSGMMLLLSLAVEHEELGWHMNMLASKQMGMQRLLFWGLPSGMLILGCVLFERAVPLSRLSSLAYLGDISYSLYLVQPFAVIAAARFKTVLVHMHPVFFSLLVAGACIATAAVSYELLEKRAVRRLKRLFDRPHNPRAIEVGSAI